MKRASTIVLIGLFLLGCFFGLFWQYINSPEWWLVGVGILTAGFIAWQSWETKRAAQASKSEIDLQRVAMQQWVDIEKWRMEWVGRSSSKIDFSFEIVNPTTLPLTVTLISVSRCEPANSRKTILLTPHDRYGHRVEMQLAPSESNAAVREFALVNVYVFVVYVDAFKEKRTQVFGRTCRVRVNTPPVVGPFEGELPQILGSEEDEHE